MNLQSYPHLLRTTLTVIALLQLLIISSASSLRNLHHPNRTRGLLSEEKTRLGSMPPSCHNKCNGCHPCMAVQAPSLPSHDRVATASIRSFDDQSAPVTNYKSSNYKPLGWRCRCHDHLYNP